MGGDLESETVCRPAKSIFVLEIRVKESQTAGHSRPACGFAEHAIRVKGLQPHAAGRVSFQPAHRSPAMRDKGWVFSLCASSAFVALRRDKLRPRFRVVSAVAEALADRRIFAIKFGSRFSAFAIGPYPCSSVVKNSVFFAHLCGKSNQRSSLLRKLRRAGSGYQRLNTGWQPGGVGRLASFYFGIPPLTKPNSPLKSRNLSLICSCFSPFLLNYLHGESGHSGG